MSNFILSIRPHCRRYCRNRFSSQEEVGSGYTCDSEMKHSDSCSLLLLLDDLGSNSVHIGDTLLGKGLAHGDRGTLNRLETGGADETSSLHLDEAVSDVLTSSLGAMLGLGSSSCLGTEMSSETVDTNLLSHVQLVSDSGGTDVKPVVV